jgi:hypothetical protein
MLIKKSPIRLEDENKNSQQGGFSGKASEFYAGDDYQ